MGKSIMDLTDEVFGKKESKWQAKEKTYEIPLPDVMSVLDIKGTNPQASFDKQRGVLIIKVQP